MSANYLPWFIYRPGKPGERMDLMARTQHAEDAAAMVALLGSGAQILCCVGATWHMVWNEGQEEISAADSYDVTAETCHARRAQHQAAWDQRHKQGAKQ